MADNMADNLEFQILPQLPPQNTEVESAVLGGCLVDRIAFPRVRDLLEPSDFYLTIHQKIYAAMIDIDRNEQPIDLMSLAVWFSDRKQLDQIGGQSYLSELYEQTISAVNIDIYAQLLLRKSRDRQLIQWGQSIVALGHQSHLTNEEITDSITEGFNRIVNLSARAQGDLTAMSTIASDGYAALAKLMQEGRPPGLLTGCTDLDAMTNGYQRGSLAIVAGRPSMGKSALAFQQAFSMARQGLSVAVFSLEMSQESIFFRALASESNVAAGDIKSGRISDRDWEKIGQCYGEFPDLPIYIDDSTVSVLDIQNRIERLQQRTGKPVDAVVIDYLGLMKGIGNDPNREISNISRSLKAMAKKYNIPVILLSQLNRSVESRSDKRPMMADLRDSGALEQDADLVIALYRDEYYNKETVDRNVAELLILKHRNGPVGTVKMLFEPMFTRFRNMEARNEY
jgi:replicative DNA helicase